MTPNENVTKQDVDFIETALPDGPGGSFDAFGTAEAFAERIGFEPAWGRNRVSKILRKTRTVESENWEPTCHNVRERVRAAYARQNEPRVSRPFAPAVHPHVAVGDSVTVNGKTFTVTRVSTTTHSDEPSKCSFSGEETPTPVEPIRAATAPETNPPIGGKARSERDKTGVDIHGSSCIVSRAELERAAAERKELREELARTKAALASIKADDSGLRAALEKCEATLEGARVHSIGASGGFQWADVVLPGGLLVRVKGGAAK